MTDRQRTLIKLIVHHGIINYGDNQLTVEMWLLFLRLYKISSITAKIAHEYFERKRIELRYEYDNYEGFREEDVNGKYYIVCPLFLHFESKLGNTLDGETYRLYIYEVVDGVYRINKSQKLYESSYINGKKQYIKNKREKTKGKNKR